MKQESIVFIGATMAPLVKVGGLADVMESLPEALVQQGLHVQVLLPFYDTIKKTPGMEKIKETTYTVSFAKKQHHVIVHTFKKESGVIVHLLADKHFFRGTSVYPLGYVPKTSIKKENRRFSFFAVAATAFVERLDTPPDVIHVHDWHSAGIPYLLKKTTLVSSKTLLTIHNLHFQGTFPKKHVEKLTGVSFPNGTTVNFMKLGIEHADKINTVSPTYAKEILTPEFGEGLQALLKKRKKDLSGIVNGINLERFNPKTDMTLVQQYTKATYKAGKAGNRKNLLKLYKMKDTGGPLFGMVSRLFDQKGLSILMPLLPDVIKRGGMVVILGSGDTRYEKQLRIFAKRYKKTSGITIGFDAALANRIYAASDFFLMPSLFEPCGLGQMIAMRYGTLPLVRTTGGLKDTVIGSGKHANGITFSPFTQKGLATAFTKAFAVHSKPAELHSRIQNAFATDFSWEISAKEYQSLYKSMS